MIAKLRGLLDSVGPDWAILDCGGVGYLVHCSGRTLRRLGAPGEPAVLRVDTVVRDDAIVLYGFADPAEQDWFRLLTAIQGVGARVALAILSVLDPSELTQAIAAQDRAALTRADGVGPKLANRILSELKDKVGGLTLGPAALAGAAVAAASAPPAASAAADAVSALVNLGYRRAEAFGAIATVAQRLGPAASVEDLIRDALKELSAA